MFTFSFFYLIFILILLFILCEQLIIVIPSSYHSSSNLMNKKHLAKLDRARILRQTMHTHMISKRYTRKSSYQHQSTHYLSNMMNSQSNFFKLTFKLRLNWHPPLYSLYLKDIWSVWWLWPMSKPISFQH